MNVVLSFNASWRLRLVKNESFMNVITECFFGQVQLVVLMNGAFGKRGAQGLQVWKTVSSIDERLGKNHGDVRFAIGVYKKLEKKAEYFGFTKIEFKR